MLHDRNQAIFTTSGLCTARGALMQTRLQISRARGMCTVRMRQLQLCSNFALTVSQARASVLAQSLTLSRI